ncbi:hypothetical protein K0651_04305 [Ornithinimicrobium sp. Arc0846-15]|nr:hypothetical protein [Ornithinimicrobium laminariae]
MKAITRLSTGALVLAMLTGCSTGDDCPGGDCSTPDGQTDTSSVSPTAAETEGAEMNDQPRVRAAVADLASRWDVSEEDIQIAEHRSVTWPDGSAGCPQPGQAYTQALVPGELLILSVAGKRSNYHSANGGDFAYCESPIQPSKTQPINPDI